ncbi:MAG: hypothetical protein LBD82_01895 [Deltaproteobacteria bacterium]|nr:hypothetical protein [Deltaproteobacteria bacterium]
MWDRRSLEAFKAAKEIAIKFIETGRVSPANFVEVFPEIYRVLCSSTLEKHPEQSPAAPDAAVAETGRTHG